MRLLSSLVALALAAPAAPVAAEDPLPPPPPPPSFEPAPFPPPPPSYGADPARGGSSSSGSSSYSSPYSSPDRLRARPAAARRAGTIGEAPVAPAGSQAAPLHPDESVSHWRFALATGVTGKFGGFQISRAEENPGVLLYFGGQADGLWTEGYGHAARVRLRLFTGGESEIYVPSDGDAEAAYMIGRREFRFVIGRAEVGRYPGLAVQTLAQLATLPCFEGSLSMARDSMRLYYYISPIEAAYVYYLGRAHIDHSAAWATESDRPVAATAGRLRYTVLLPPSVLLSLQGDLVKMWQKADLLVAAEGGLGYQVLDQSATFNAVVRWNSYTRRGPGPGTNVTESDFQMLAIATLVF